jgi:hypothetical protein
VNIQREVELVSQFPDTTGGDRRESLPFEEFGHVISRNTRLEESLDDSVAAVNDILIEVEVVP